MNCPTIIGDELAAELFDRDGETLLAAVHRLTPRQACAALAFLAGYDWHATNRAVDFARTPATALSSRAAVRELAELGEAA